MLPKSYLCKGHRRAINLHLVDFLAVEIQKEPLLQSLVRCLGREIELDFCSAQEVGMLTLLRGKVQNQVIVHIR